MQYKLDEVTKNGTVYVHIANDEDESFKLRVGKRRFDCQYCAFGGGGFEMEIDIDGGDDGRFNISGGSGGNCELKGNNGFTMKGTRDALFDYAVDELAKL